MADATMHAYWKTFLYIISFTTSTFLFFYEVFIWLNISSFETLYLIIYYNWKKYFTEIYLSERLRSNKASIASKAKHLSPFHLKRAAVDPIWKLLVLNETAYLRHKSRPFGQWRLLNLHKDQSNMKAMIHIAEKAFGL